MKLPLVALLLVGCSSAQVKTDKAAINAVACDVCIVRCAGCGTQQKVTEEAACAVCLVSCGIVQASREAGAP